MIRSFAIAVAVVAAVVSQSAATHCVQCNQQRSYVQREYVAPIVQEKQYVTQNIFYSVGDSVRYPIVAPAAVVAAEYSQLERELQRVQDKMSDLKQYSSQQYSQAQTVCIPVCQTQQTQQIQQYSQQQRSQSSASSYGSSYGQQSRAIQSGGVVEAKCLRCHGASGKAKGNLDLRDPISCEQFKHAMQRIMTDDNDLRMPKGQPPLTGEETASAIKELLAMTIQDRPPGQQLPAQPRPPQASQLPAQPPQPAQLPADQPATSAPMPPPAQPAQQPAPPESAQPSQ